MCANQVAMQPATGLNQGDLWFLHLKLVTLGCLMNFTGQILLKKSMILLVDCIIKGLYMCSNS